MTNRDLKIEMTTLTINKDGDDYLLDSLIPTPFLYMHLGITKFMVYICTRVLLIDYMCILSFINCESLVSKIITYFYTKFNLGIYILYCINMGMRIRVRPCLHAHDLHQSMWVKAIWCEI